MSLSVRIDRVAKHLKPDQPRTVADLILFLENRPLILPPRNPLRGLLQEAERFEVNTEAPHDGQSTATH